MSTYSKKCVYVCVYMKVIGGKLSFSIESHSFWYYQFLQEGFERNEDENVEIKKLKDALVANVTRHGGTWD